MIPIHPIDRMLLIEGLETALAGGCGLCDVPRDWFCAACDRCNCHDHRACVRPEAER